MVIIQRLVEGEVGNLDALNDNMAKFAALINSMSQQQLVQFGATPGDPGTAMPLLGGDFVGQITAPSMLVGPAAGPKYPVVTENDTASSTVAGIVMAAVAIADLAQTISATPTQAEVQAISDKMDELLGGMRTAGLLEP